MEQKHIRNFCIIAHIDHGKSTLADRILEITGAVTKREMRAQYLDSMDLERERGITIKAQTVRLYYQCRDGNKYQFNLIDTPGHVDFTYEVSRSMGACEGALLVVDASQGVEAQSIANAFIASDSNLEIIPVLNKVDLPVADIEKTKQEIEEIIGIGAKHAIAVSAKTGKNVEDLLEEVVHLIPPPKGDENKPLKALIFDSWFDPYVGVITLVRVRDGVLKEKMKIKLHATGTVFEVMKVGVFSPKPVYLNELKAGEVGFIAAGMKDVSEAKIGDTILEEGDTTSEPLPGFKPIKQMVFCGFYPVEANEYGMLKDSLDKLHLNDSSFTYEKDSSEALGFGFRCGFLGLLHMDVIQERLEREFNVDLITTAPSVVYKIVMDDGEVKEINNPCQLPDTGVDHIEEPYMRVRIHTPADYVGGLLALCNDKRGEQEDMICYQNNRVQLIYDLPLSEVMYDFFDTLKSISRGYASMDYEILEYRESKLVKLDILINGKIVDALSTIVHAENSYNRGRDLASKLRKEIKRQMFEVAIQAAIGSRVIARESVSALRKNVTAKCYGGDVTRKRKLLEKQKAGKKRMKRVGNVEIPQAAFLAVLKVK
ncbi:MAG: translation elongation factor 4 [Pseudomonadota bacterium]